MSERQIKAGNQEYYWKLEKLSICHSLNMLNNFCFHVYAQKSLFHTQTPTLKLSHSFTFSFTHPWHAKQLFCFHVYAQKSLFISINVNAFWGDIHHTHTPDIRVHRAGSQLKNICVVKICES